MFSYCIIEWDFPFFPSLSLSLSLLLPSFLASFLSCFLSFFLLWILLWTQRIAKVKSSLLKSCGYAHNKLTLWTCNLLFENSSFQTNLTLFTTVIAWCVNVPKLHMLNYIPKYQNFAVFGHRAFKEVINLKSCLVSRIDPNPIWFIRRGN